LAGVKEQLCRATFEAAALTLGEATPDTKSLIMREGIIQTFTANLAREAYALCLSR
jgi:hypothetical protein